MKNVFFALAFMLIGTFAFANTNVVNNVIANNDTITCITNTNNLDRLSVLVVTYFEHTCTYKIINTQGETVGTVILSGVPDDVSCDSKKAKAAAIKAFENDAP